MKYHYLGFDEYLIVSKSIKGQAVSRNTMTAFLILFDRKTGDICFR